MPDVIERLVIVGVGRTEKEDPLLLTPLAFTITFPVVAPDGTVTVMLVAVQELTEAVVPLKVTEPLPCEDPKFDPATTTDAPTAPDEGVRFEILGAATTVKFTPLVFTPLAFTTTFPVVAPDGTVT